MQPLGGVSGRIGVGRLSFGQRRVWAFGLLILLAAALVHTQTGAATSPAGNDAAPSSRVPVLRVEPRSVSSALPFEGVVEAVRQATVASQVVGRILELRVDVGQRVQAGQVLVRIDARELVESIAAAKAAATAAKNNYERTEKLVTQKFISAAALDKARADLQVAEAQVLAAQAGHSHAAIAAPISGIVSARHAEVGEMAAPGRALFTVYEPGALRLTAQVPQARIPELRAAKSLRVDFPELGQSIELTSFQILPVFDATTHTAEVRIALPAGGVSVLPGMAGRIRFLGSAAERLSIPVSALVHRGEMAAVYVETERQGKKEFRLRQLRLGERPANGEVEVLSGLKAGETIALDPVRAGVQSVRSKTEATASPSPSAR